MLIIEIRFSDFVCGYTRKFTRLYRAAHRTEYADKIISAVRQHLNTGSSQAAMDIFKDDARANAYLSMGWIDINAPVDSETEHSFLHFAAKADDVGLVNWALARGADPGVKDRKGKKPAEVFRDNASAHHGSCILMCLLLAMPEEGQ